MGPGVTCQTCNGEGWVYVSDELFFGRQHMIDPSGAAREEKKNVTETSDDSGHFYIDEFSNLSFRVEDS